MSAADLIRELNPKIRGWANYHRHVVSTRTFARVDLHIFSVAMGTTKTPEQDPTGANRNTLRRVVVATGPSSLKSVMTKASPFRFGCGTPVAHPSSDTLKSKLTRTPTTLPLRPTSKNAKKLICRIRFGVLARFAFSGVNNAALHCVQYQNHSDHGLAPSPLRSPCDGWFAKRRKLHSTSSRVP
jgi:hypothetical protein